MTTKITKDNVRKKKVLIVDDKPDVNTILKNVLEQSGFNVTLMMIQIGNNY